MVKIGFKSMLLFKFLTLLTLNVAHAQVADSFSTELGFKRLSHPSTPKMLVNASDSVFEVRSIFEDKLEDLQTWDLTDPKYLDIEAKIDSVSALDEKEKFIIKRQLRNCREHGNEKECSVFLGIEKGTAFLAGEDGATLWTNAHVVSRFVKLRGSFSGKTVPDYLKSDGRVAIFLFDKNGKLVFDPFTDSSIIKAYPQDVSLLAALRGTWYAEDSDFVKIRLSRAIGKPLPIGPKPAKGDLLFRPGFPACTGCSENPNQTDPIENQSRGAGLDSDGKGLYWTSGNSQDIETVNNFLGRDIGNLVDINKMVFFSADSQVGLSGGPILNHQGEVVGIFAGSKPKIVKSQLLILSRGLRPPPFDK